MGTSHEHLEYPGTLSFSADTLMSVVMDLGASVRRAGVRKVVLTNGHGGNVALLNVAAYANLPCGGAAGEGGLAMRAKVVAHRI